LLAFLFGLMPTARIQLAGSIGLQLVLFSVNFFSKLRRAVVAASLSLLAAAGLSVCTLPAAQAGETAAAGTHRCG
jgi:hypothetical protein